MKWIMFEVYQKSRYYIVYVSRMFVQNLYFKSSEINRLGDRERVHSFKLNQLKTRLSYIFIHDFTISININVILWVNFKFLFFPGWRSCANDLACASKCVQAYMSRYINFSGCSHSCESYARIHNGGPAGCKHTNTLGYWSHIQSQGCHHNSK